MKRHMINVGIVLGLGLGLTWVLLWLLGGVPSVVQAQESDLDMGQLRGTPPTLSDLPDQVFDQSASPPSTIDL